LVELTGIDLRPQRDRHVTGEFHDRLGLVDARVQHFLLHQIACKRPSGAETEHGDAHQNAEMGAIVRLLSFKGTPGIEAGRIRERITRTIV
jgi:hypothetical protein